MNDLLKSYSEEIGLFSEMTLESLIKSHRHLRELNKVRHTEWLKELEKGREIGRIQAEKVVKEQEWINVERLKNMTVAELVNFVNDI